MRKLLWMIAALLLIAPCRAQVTLGNYCSAVTASLVNTINCTLSSIASNSLVIVTIAADDDGSKTFVAPTATGLTFTTAGPLEHLSDEAYMQNFCAYTASSLGSTAVTSTWTGTADDASLIVATLTGTASGCSSAIGGTAGAATGSSSTVTVTSTGHNNSKYYGTVNTYTDTITPGTAYTTAVAQTSNGSSIESTTELSTSPVSPAASTVVNFSSTGGGPVSYAAIVGLEIVVASGGSSYIQTQPGAFEVGP